MLFLLFDLDHDRYAIDANQIVEVLPLVRVKPVPQSPPAVAGLVSYRGVPVPVVDLSELIVGRPAVARLTTRLLIVRYAAEAGSERLLGLIVEQATDMLRRDAADFAASSIGGGRTMSAGPVTTDGRGLIQWLNVNALLPASLTDTLFANAAGA